MNSLAEGCRQLKNQRLSLNEDIWAVLSIKGIAKRFTIISNCFVFLAEHFCNSRSSPAYNKGKEIFASKKLVIHVLMEEVKCEVLEKYRFEC